MKVEGCKFHTICMRELYDFMTSDEESSMGSFWGGENLFLFRLHAGNLELPVKIHILNASTSTWPFS